MQEFVLPVRANFQGERELSNRLAVLLITTFLSIRQRIGKVLPEGLDELAKVLQTADG